MNLCVFFKSHPHLLKLALLALTFLPVTTTASTLSSCERSLLPEKHQQEGAPEAESSEKTIFTEFRESGLPLEEATRLLKDHSIPETLWSFYHFERGIFEYRTDRTVPLAIENGDAKLKAIRIHVERIFPELGAATVQSFGQALERMAGVELWIVSNKDNAAWIDSLTWTFPKDVRNRIQFIPYDSYTYPWAQDGSKPLADGSGVLATFVDEEDFRVNYLGATTTATKAKNLRLEPSYFRFQGGNTLVGDKHIFVGAQVINSVQTDLKISRTDAIRALTVEFGKPVIEIEQTDFHIDLTLSIVRDRITGDEVVLLDSQVLGIDLLLNERKTSPIPDDTEQFFKALLAEPHHRSSLTRGERALKKVLENESFGSLMSREETLDTTAQRLKDLGYRVIRVPGLYTAGNHLGSTRIFNYSNAVYSGPFALVAEMGVETWDLAVQNVLRQLGYDPIPMPVAQLSLVQLGSIHCLTEGYRRPILKP